MSRNQAINPNDSILLCSFKYIKANGHKDLEPWGKPIFFHVVLSFTGCFICLPQRLEVVVVLVHQFENQHRCLEGPVKFRIDGLPSFISSCRPAPDSISVAY